MTLIQTIRSRKNKLQTAKEEGVTKVLIFEKQEKSLKIVSYIFAIFRLVHGETAFGTSFI
jgi:hypothetical protein